MIDSVALQMRGYVRAWVSAACDWPANELSDFRKVSVRIFDRNWQIWDERSEAVIRPFSRILREIMGWRCFPTSHSPEKRFCKANHTWENRNFKKPEMTGHVKSPSSDGDSPRQQLFIIIVIIISIAYLINYSWLEISFPEYSIMMKKFNWNNIRLNNNFKLTFSLPIVRK